MKIDRIISLEKLQRMAVDERFPRKKVLLIDGNVTEAKYQKSEYHLRLDNLGLRRIAGFLKKFGIAVSMISLRELNKNRLAKRLIEEAEIIGISAQSTSINESFNFCRDIKQRHPDKIIVGGAEHFALDFDWILKNKSITGMDVCCLGQGELPMLALALGISLKKIGSIAFRQHGIIIENSRKNNKNFPRLQETGMEVLKTAPAIPDNPGQALRRRALARKAGLF